MDKILTWPLLAPVAGYCLLRLSHLRYMVGLQSGYHLLFLSLFFGIVSMGLVAIALGVCQGKELTIKGLLPTDDEEFFRIWISDIALILFWGACYWIWNQFKSEEAVTKVELKVAKEYGEKVVYFLGKSMIKKTLAQVSMEGGKEYFGYVSAIPTPLPMWGLWGVHKEVSIRVVRYEFPNRATGEITIVNYSSYLYAEEDTPVIHIPLDKIESVGTLSPDDAAHELSRDDRINVDNN